MAFEFHWYLVWPQFSPVNSMCLVWLRVYLIYLFKDFFISLILFALLLCFHIIHPYSGPRKFFFLLFFQTLKVSHYISYSSVAIIRYKQKQLWLTGPDGVGNGKDSMAAGGWSRKLTDHKEQEVEQGSNPLSPSPPELKYKALHPNASLTSPNSATSCRPSVEIFEFMRDISHSSCYSHSVICLGALWFLNVHVEPK